VKAWGLKAGAKGAMGLPVLACWPRVVGGLLWQLLHDHSPPWRVLNSCWPRVAWPGVPAWALQRSSCCVGLVSAALVVAVADCE